MACALKALLSQLAIPTPKQTRATTVGHHPLCFEMNDTVWKAMVEVQQARRGRATDVPKLEISRPVLRAVPRRKRPTTLRSVRKLLVPDHYAILSAGEY